MGNLSPAGWNEWKRGVGHQQRASRGSRLPYNFHQVDFNSIKMRVEIHSCPIPSSSSSLASCNHHPQGRPIAGSVHCNRLANQSGRFISSAVSTNCVAMVTADSEIKAATRPNGSTDLLFQWRRASILVASAGCHGDAAQSAKDSTKPLTWLRSLFPFVSGSGKGGGKLRFNTGEREKWWRRRRRRRKRRSHGVPRCSSYTCFGGFLFQRSRGG